MIHCVTAEPRRVERRWRHEQPGGELRRGQTSSGDGSGVRHYQVDDLQGGHNGRYRGRCPLHQGEGRDALREAALQLQDWLPGAATRRERPSRQRVTKENICDNPPLRFTLRGVDGSDAYLAAREIQAGTAARFGVGFYRGPGLMSGRVVIPIHDERGRLVAYAGRAVDGRKPRYRFPAGFGKSQVLFNFHRAAATRSDTVLVVEGFFDCLRVSQAGFESVVALMGTELYEHPVQLLRDRFRRVALLLDGDAAGRVGRDRVAARLRDLCEVCLIGLPEGRQPDQLPEGELRQLIEWAMKSYMLRG